MRYLQAILLVFLVMKLSAQSSAHWGAAKFVPPQGKRLLIIGQDLGAVGGLEGYADGYVDHLNQIPSGVTTYTNLSNLVGIESYANWGSGDIHAQQYIEDPNFDFSVLAIGLYISGGLNSIVDGFRDNNIRELGNWIKNSDRPVFLRIGYEFDGPWNDHNPTLFKEAWIHIVQIFDQNQVTNVAYVWQSAGINTPNLERWYPGDEYVNWLGYSHFDQQHPEREMLNFAQAHDKPIMIAEATPRARDLMEGDGLAHWNRWFSPLFETINDNEQIKALAYINVDWESQPMWEGEGWGDSRVQVNDYVMGNWLTETDKSTWLKGNESLFAMLEYSKWRDSLPLSTGFNELSQESVQIRMQRVSQGVIISTKNNQVIEDAILLDLLGKHVFSSNSQKTKVLIPTQYKKSELMILKITVANRTYREKIIF